MNHFIGCDWGSSSFRLRLIELPSRRVRAERTAGAGIKTFAQLGAQERAARMARFFAEQIAMLPKSLKADRPIVITGMASSSVGWRELPYAAAPFPLDGSRAVADTIEFDDTNGARRSVLLVSGVRTVDDVMRGEECALIGAHALHPELSRGDHLCLLAGTHPKHVRVRDGVLTEFRTHLTGELFDLLVRESLLAMSVSRDAVDFAPDIAAFRAGVACVRNRGASAALFQVRARQLLRGVDKSANTWFLSGVLLGGELAHLEAGAGGAKLALIGEPTRIGLYRAALGELGVLARLGDPIQIDLNEAMIAGQASLATRGFSF